MSRLILKYQIVGFFLLLVIWLHYDNSIMAIFTLPLVIEIYGVCAWSLIGLFRDPDRRKPAFIFFNIALTALSIFMCGDTTINTSRAYWLSQQLHLSLNKQHYEDLLAQTKPDSNGRRRFSEALGGWLSNTSDIVYDESDAFQITGTGTAPSPIPDSPGEIFSGCRAKNLRSHYYVVFCG